MKTLLIFNILFFTSHSFEEIECDVHDFIIDVNPLNRMIVLPDFYFPLVNPPPITDPNP